MNSVMSIRNRSTAFVWISLYRTPGRKTIQRILTPEGWLKSNQITPNPIGLALWLATVKSDGHRSNFRKLIVGFGLRGDIIRLRLQSMSDLELLQEYAKSVKVAPAYLRPPRQQCVSPRQSAAPPPSSHC